MRKSYCLIIAIAFLLISCASAPKPTAEELSTADYGPSPSNYEEIIKAIIAPTLIDPYSAVYNLSVPKKGRNTMSGKPIYGWNICGSINAKNRYGGYVGAKPVYAMIYNDKVVRLLFRGTTIPDSFGLGMLSGAMDTAGSSEKYCED